MNPVAFRFGLTGRRWGSEGPVVLMLHEGRSAPSELARLIEPLVASGHQVIALDDPTDAGADEAERVSEYASAAREAAVELRDLEGVVGHGLGAAAAAQAFSSAKSSPPSSFAAAPRGAMLPKRASSNASAIWASLASGIARTSPSTSRA